jgi:hypothetical protein
MSTVRFGESEWALRFSHRTLKELEDYLEEGAAPLRWLPAFQQKIARDDTRSIALAIWAGLGASGSGIDPLDVLALINEASPEEDETLAGDVLRALQNDLPSPKESPSDEKGQPWDWRVALAAWSTEWKQPPTEFWTMTPREFSDLSDGRSILYASVQEGGAPNSGETRIRTMEDFEELFKLRG